MRNPSRNLTGDLPRGERRVDGLLQLALAAVVVLLASSMVRVTVTRFGYQPTVDRLHAAQAAQADASSGMLAMETGLRGYQLSADDRFLQPYRDGQHALLVATRTVEADLVGFPALAADWRDVLSRADRWRQGYAAPAVDAVHPGAPRPSVGSLLDGLTRFDQYRIAAAGAASHLADTAGRQRDAENLFRTSTGVTQGVALVLLAFALVRRFRRSPEPDGGAFGAAARSHASPGAAAFAAAGDLDTLALSIAAAGRELAGATAAALWLAEGDDLRRVEPGGPMIVAQRRRHDVALRAHREGAITTSVSRSRRTLAVPLLHEGRTLGVVELSMPPGSPAPNHAQIEALRAWGRQAAKAIAYGPGSVDRDQLTGFAGRPKLLAELAAAVDASLDSEQPVSLVVLEVDHLDAGTAAGTAHRDDLVRTVGAVLADTVRASDTAYRIGEGNFAVLLRDAPAPAAASLAERLRQIIARRFVERGVTVSFGVATCPDVAQDVSALVEAAQAALYDAQRFGGNRVQLARPLSDELAMVRRRSSEID